MILNRKLYKPQYLIVSILKTLGVFFKYVFIDHKKNKTNNIDQLGIKTEEKGFPVLIFQKGKTRCTSCGFCEEVCPTSCIDIKSKSKKSIEHKQEPLNFTINYINCISCSECIKVCGFNALKVEKNIAWDFQNIDSFVWDIEKFQYFYDSE